MAFAGFAGLASVFGDRQGTQRRTFDIYDRVAMIGFSVQAAAFALLPRILAALGVDQLVAWRASAIAMAAALLAWSLYGASRRRRIAEAEGVSGREATDWLPRAGLVISVGISALVVFLPAQHVAGVYIAALFGMLAFSSAYFLRMLIPPFR